MGKASIRPWFWAVRNAWFVQHQGKRISLNVKGMENEAEAIRAWHRVMAEMPVEVPKAKHQPKPEPVKHEPSCFTVKAMLEAFLSDVASRVKANSFSTYREYLEPFSVKHESLNAEALNLPTVYQWANRPAWSPSHGTAS